VLSTHYHLVVESTRADLSAGLHRLNWRYADHVNDRHDRFGHVFAERFQARVIETEEYLYDACAYVFQNPVQAGLCDRPQDWPWTYSRYAA
jgi:REP element-mobilizing transposase RayT